MNKRFEEIFSSIPTCSVFADIGCDHGYISKAMLERGKAKKVLASDISEKCLEKARDLLKAEIVLGKAECIVSNGFDNLSGCDCALIAGMGGEEIILILKNAVITRLLVYISSFSSILASATSAFPLWLI